MPGLLSWLAGLFATALGQSALRFVAWKMVIATLVMSIFPIVLVNVLYEIIEGLLLIRDSNVVQSGSFQASVYQLTGLAGWLASALKIPEAVSLILSAIMLRMSINWWKTVFLLPRS